MQQIRLPGPRPPGLPLAHRVRARRLTYCAVRGRGLGAGRAQPGRRAGAAARPRRPPPARCGGARLCAAVARRRGAARDGMDGRRGGGGWLPGCGLTGCLAGAGPGAVVSVYSFGAPRVGNRAFAHLYNYAVPQVRRGRAGRGAGRARGEEGRAGGGWQGTIGGGAEARRVGAVPLQPVGAAQPPGPERGPGRPSLRVSGRPGPQGHQDRGPRRAAACTDTPRSHRRAAGPALGPPVRLGKPVPPATHAPDGSLGGGGGGGNGGGGGGGDAGRASGWCCATTWCRRCRGRRCTRTAGRRCSPPAPSPRDADAAAAGLLPTRAQRRTRTHAGPAGRGAGPPGAEMAGTCAPAEGLVVGAARQRQRGIGALPAGRLLIAAFRVWTEITGYASCIRCHLNTLGINLYHMQYYPISHAILLGIEVPFRYRSTLSAQSRCFLRTPNEQTDDSCAIIFPSTRCHGNIIEHLTRLLQQHWAILLSISPDAVWAVKFTRYYHITSSIG